MDQFLDDLFHKRGSTREGALSSLIDGFIVKYRSHFAGKNFATLLYRCLNSFKKGSSKEIVLASHALGLLAITMGSGDNAHELYKESLPLIAQALKSRTESLLLSIIWSFIHPKPGENVVGRKLSDSILSAAISAWSLLLTTVDGWNLNHNHWRGAISFFVDLLEVEDQSVLLADVESLALICEVGCLEKFDSNTTIDNISFMEKGKNISNQHSYMQELQQIISNHSKRLFRLGALDSSTSKTLKSNFSWDILKVLEGGHFHETTLKIGKHSLQLHSLSQLLQVKFLKRYLGRGFVPHMLENEFLRDVFNFTPRKQMSGVELYTSEREEVTIHLFVPERRQRDCEDDPQRTNRSTDPAVRKAKTQLLNKQRMIKGKELSPFHD